MSYYFWPTDLHGRDKFGLKGRGLAELQMAGFLIPQWFVIPSEGFYSSLGDEEYSLIQYAQETRTLPAMQLSFQLSHHLHQDVLRAMKELCPRGERVAVRPSVVGEAKEEQLVRPLMESYLFLLPEEVARGIRRVWIRGFHENVVDARKRAGLPPLPKAPAVIVQRMLDPEFSGKAMTADPASGRRGVTVVEAIYGLSTAIATGLTKGDSYRLNRYGEILERHIEQKKVAHRCSATSETGVEAVKVDDAQQSAPVLTDSLIRQVAELARKAAIFFGVPQEIEWAWSDGKLYLLSSRDLVEVMELPDPDAPVVRYTADRYVDDYVGVVTPLTHSLVRRRELGRMKAVGQLYGVFEDPTNKIGRYAMDVVSLIDNRLFCNQERLLRVIEQFKGVRPVFFKEENSGEKGGKKESLAGADRLGALYRAYKMEKLVARELKPKSLPFADMRIDELLPMLHQFISLWDRFHLSMGGLKLAQELVKIATVRRLERCGLEAGEAVLGELVVGLEKSVYVQQLQELKKISQKVCEDEGLFQILREGDAVKSQGEIAKHPELQALIDRYLEKYGVIRPGAHLIESPMLQEHISWLYGAIVRLEKNAFEEMVAEAGETENPSRRISGLTLASAVKNHPWHRNVVKWNIWFLKRALVAEYRMRFTEARLLAWGKEIINEIGRRFKAIGVLENPEDVHFFTIWEIVEQMHGSGATNEVNAQIHQRKSEYLKHKKKTEGSRAYGLNTRAPVCMRGIREWDTLEVNKKAVKIKGQAGTGGLKRGKIRFYDPEDETELKKGDILVVRGADEGYALLLAGLNGVICESGSLDAPLLHLGKALGISVIVGVREAYSWLKAGDLVEINGGNQEIRRISGKV